MTSLQEYLEVPNKSTADSSKNTRFYFSYFPRTVHDWNQPDPHQVTCEAVNCA